MDKQTKEAREMAKNLPFKEKIKHFWYYYKIQTVAAFITALVIGISIYQVVTRPSYDLQITYYGSGTAFSQTQADMLEEYLGQYIEDIDGNGEKNVNIFMVNSSLGSSPEYRMAMNQRLIAEVSSGKSMVYIFDDYFYKYAGPDSDVGAFETSVAMSDNYKLKDMLALNEPIYWCTKLLYESEEEDETAVLAHSNAVLAEKAISGENN